MIEALKLMSIFFCMLASAFFSGMETGITAINRLRLKHFVRQGVAAAKILQGFVENSDRLLGTTLIGNNICLVVMAVFSASLAEEWFGPWAEPVAPFIISAFVLVFGEYLPKAWFAGKPYYRSVRFARTLVIADRLLGPLSSVVVGITRLMVRGAKKSFAEPLPFVSREDIKSLTRDGEKSGVLSREETKMINSVFELSHKKAADIMIPRDDMKIIPRDASIEEFLEKARECGLTRMPVYDAATREFVGIANVLYALSVHTSSTDRCVMAIARPPQFIPHDMPVDDIFPRLRRFRQPMCLVRNNNNGVIGLVTTEDILEEVVGEL
jgi:CBS domain containing-hemolysin-like protein